MDQKDIEPRDTETVLQVLHNGEDLTKDRLTVCRSQIHFRS